MNNSPTKTTHYDELNESKLGRGIAITLFTLLSLLAKAQNIEPLDVPTSLSSQPKQDTELTQEIRTRIDNISDEILKELDKLDNDASKYPDYTEKIKELVRLIILYNTETQLDLFNAETNQKQLKIILIKANILIASLQNETYGSSAMNNQTSYEVRVLINQWATKDPKFLQKASYNELLMEYNKTYKLYKKT